MSENDDQEGRDQSATQRATTGRASEAGPDPSDQLTPADQSAFWGEKWIRNLRARSRGLIVCGLGYILGLVGLAFADDADTAEAFTVLGAALASAGGAEIGHGSGERSETHEHKRFHQALCVATLLTTGLAFWGAVSLDRMTAALTLILAAMAVVSVHHGHEIFVERRDSTADEALGWVFVAGAVLFGLAGVLAWREKADIAAMLAAALVTVGGTLVGHARGHRRTGQRGDPEQA